MIPIVFAPLMIHIDGERFWKNSKPNSPESCFPIELLIEKETPEVNRAILKKIQFKLTEISGYFEDFIEGFFLKITYNIDPHIVMLDGQTSNQIYSNRDTQKCYICEKKGQEFFANNSDIYNNRCDLGIKPLHSTLRIFDKLLQISYKQGIKKCDKSTDKTIKIKIGQENKTKISEKRKIIHKEFWDKLCIDVDRPRQGYGTTTTGKCAKIALENFKITSEILNIEQSLIEKLNIRRSL